MRVMFYAPQHTGHHFAYLARMMPGFVDLPIERIVVTSPEGLRSEEFAKTLAAFADRVKFVTSCTLPSRPGRVESGMSKADARASDLKDLTGS